MMMRMRWRTSWAAGLAVCGLLMSAAWAQDKTEQAQKDWKALGTLCEQYRAKFQSESDIKKRAATFRTEWETWKKEFEPVRAAFQKRYGEQVPAVSEAFENIPKPAGVRIDAWEAANLAYNLDLANEEQKFVGWIVGWAKDAKRIASTIKPENREKLELRVKRTDDAIRYYKLAREWNPKGDYDAPLRELEGMLEEAMPAWKKVLVELKWPGHNTAFSGTNKPDELAAAALEFLAKHPDWTKPEYDDEHAPLAACVEGKGWEVSKKAPLTEQPTQYSLDMFVVFAGQKDPEMVYAYHMVFYTREEAGVKPELPFHYANSKQYASFRMLKANVPAK